MTSTTEIPFPAKTADPAQPLADPSQPIVAKARQIETSDDQDFVSKTDRRKLAALLLGHARSRVAAIVTDAVGRMLVYVDERAGSIVTNIPAVFKRAVTLPGLAIVPGPRSGILSILDKVGRRLIYLHAVRGAVFNIPVTIGNVFSIKSEKGRAVRSSALALLDKAGKRLLFLGDRGLTLNVPLRLRNIVSIEARNDRSGSLFNVKDANKRYLINLRRNGLWILGKKVATLADINNAVPDETYIPPRLAPVGNVIDCWGDSLTAADPYAEMVQLIGGGLQRRIFGFGGRGSWDISARMGAETTRLDAANGQVLGDGGTTVITNVSTNLLVAPFLGYVEQERGIILGVGNSAHGTLYGTPVDTDGDGNPNRTDYKFISDAGEPTIVVAPQSQFLPDNRIDTRDHAFAICVGRNGYEQTDRIRSNIERMMEVPRRTHRRIMLFGVINGAFSYEYRGQSGWETIRTLNMSLRELYPNNYVVDAKGRDLRERLVASYDPNIPADVLAFERDTVPPSLQVDAIHLNAAGKSVWAHLGAEFWNANIL